MTKTQSLIAVPAIAFSVGTQVAVMGASNPDGSITAESVQIRPVGFSATSTRIRQ